VVDAKTEGVVASADEDWIGEDPWGNVRTVDSKGVQGTARWGVIGISSAKPEPRLPFPEEFPSVQVANGAGVLASAEPSPNLPALEIAGGISVGNIAQQSERPAFRHVVTASNFADDLTYIDHIYANDAPTAILLVTPFRPPGSKEGFRGANAVGVTYDDTRKR